MSEMEKNEVLKIYKSVGALLEGHFILSSGLHSKIYLQSALIFSTVLILLIEANAIKGKMGPMASVKGVIHCGVLLTVVLYCSHCFI